MAKSIDIASLKSGTTGIDASRDEIVDPNVKKTTNAEASDPRDFGNGLREFDPIAAGFKSEEVETGEAPDEAALNLFDQQMAEREEEVRTYNELLEINGGQVSETELREALGQSSITDSLQDGEGGKFEDEPGTAVPVQTAPTSTASVFEDKESESEIDELERELEEDDNFITNSEVDSAHVHQNTIAVGNMGVTSSTIQPSNLVSNDTVVTAPINTELSNPRVTEFVPRKESEVDENGVSQEDKDLAALDGTGEENIDEEDFETKLKRELNKKLAPVSKKINVAAATVIAKPITVNNILERNKNKARKVFTWPLMRSCRPITIQSFNATELNTLNNNARNANMTAEVFRTIWKHIVAGQGESFESWCKSISYFDTDHLWFAIYGACFQDANYLPFQCPKCNDVTVTTDTPLMDMVKFKDDEVRRKFEAIRSSNDEIKENVFAEYRVQISDDLVIGFVEPSIYTSIIQNNMYDREFRDKYADIINIINYINEIYVIDENGNLRPIATKQFINNDAKTAKARVIQYAKLIRSLDSDEYAVIMSHIIEMGRSTDDVSYKMPEISCDHCKSTIPSEDQDASSLVFTRHQLVMFGA